MAEKRGRTEKTSKDLSKKKRKFMSGNHGGKSKRDFHAGGRYIIVTTHPQLHGKCYHEIMGIIRRRFEKLYPKKERTETKTSGTAADKLAAETAELQNPEERAFVGVGTDEYKGLVAIEVETEQITSVSDFVDDIFNSALKEKNIVSRYCLRVAPMDVACFASPEDLAKAAAPVLQKVFPSNADKPTTFACVFNKKNNNNADRFVYIDAVAKIVPEPHKVDLKNPDVVILIHVIKGVCGIGISRRYNEFKKNNLHEVYLANPAPRLHSFSGIGEECPIPHPDSKVMRWSKGGGSTGEPSKAALGAPPAGGKATKEKEANEGDGSGDGVKAEGNAASVGAETGNGSGCNGKGENGDSGDAPNPNADDAK